MPSVDPAPPDPAALLVACLCAQWCGVCREYREAFDAARRAHPQARMLWIDIEDEADLVDPVEVENFPALLIASGERPLFFGTITPQPQTLLRLIQAHQGGTPSAMSDGLLAELTGLVARLRARDRGLS